MNKPIDEARLAATSILKVIAPPDIRKAAAIPLPGETEEERKRRDEVSRISVSFHFFVTQTRERLLRFDAAQ